MTKAVAEEVALTDVDAAFEAVKTACISRGIKVARLDSPAPNSLGLELIGSTRKWPVYVACNEELLRLPAVWSKPPVTPLAHVSYAGSICIDDGQGLSLDPDRRTEIVAYAVLKAYDLLESSTSDATTGYTEFYNELEGYWLHLPGSLRSRAYFEVDGNSRLVKGFVNSNLKTPKWFFVERDAEVPWEVKECQLACNFDHLSALNFDQSTVTICGV